MLLSCQLNKNSSINTIIKISYLLKSLRLNNGVEFTLLSIFPRVLHFNLILTHILALLPKARLQTTIEVALKRS